MANAGRHGMVGSRMLLVQPRRRKGYFLRYTPAAAAKPFSRRVLPVVVVLCTVLA